MQRKVTCAFLIFTLGFSLTFCGKQEEATNINSAELKAFQKVQKNMESTKDTKFEIKLKSDWYGEGIFYPSPVEYNATGEQEMNANGYIDMKMQIREKIDTSPERIIKGYKKDNIFYMNDDSGLQLELQDTDGYAIELIYALDSLHISKEMISELEVSEKGTNTIYSFTLKQDNKTVEYVKQKLFLAAMDIEVETGGTMKGVDKIVPKCKLEIIAGENGMVKTMSMDGVLTIKYKDTQKNSVNYTYQLTVEYTGINTGLQIDFPDFSEYI